MKACNTFLLLLAVSAVHRSASESLMYPYGPEAGDRVTPVKDDGASDEIPISQKFTFFNKDYNSVFVNNNGVVSFATAVPSYTPDAFPLADGRAFVAPYWGDVNNEITGKVYYRESKDPQLLQRISNDIEKYFPNLSFKATWMFIATWFNVAYYGSVSNKVNTFQAVLATNGQRAFIMLNYDKIQWTTGTASKGDPETGLGGIPAQAGFNSGDQTHFFNIPGSRTPDILNIKSTSNVNEPSRWVFQVDTFKVPGGCTYKADFVKFGTVFWKDAACTQMCKCLESGELACEEHRCAGSETCQPNLWYFTCQAPAENPCL
ncbi:alpha-tectorin-like [Rhinatrema bivittatum]|uniref:alpha-tectorin-like n=1 Tax=Rhinatrema bivittatum TaxID=194408 RepID=UPI00112828DF|nr:alpha-tectorin-like [Rhinatrema bivittatum]